MNTTARKAITVIVYLFGIGKYAIDYLNNSTARTHKATFALQNADGTQDIISHGNSHLLLLFSTILSFVLVWTIATSVSKKSVAFVTSLVGSILMLIATFYIGDSNNSLGDDFGIVPQLIINCFASSLFPLFYMSKNIQVNKVTT